MTDQGYFGVARLTAVIERVSPAVLKVRDSRREDVCAGWLITDSLVIVTDVSAVPRTFTCEFHGAGALKRAARLVDPPGPERARLLPVVLRLNAPVSGIEPLRLARRAQPGEPIFMLHYPDGRPDQQISFGRILESEQELVVHDAPTGKGSIGSPVINSRGEITTMTTLARAAGAAGPAMSDVLSKLRESAAWPEIRDRHQLVDVASVHDRIVAHDFVRDDVVTDALLAAAVRWHVDPSGLSDEDRERLAPMVHDPEATRWNLRSHERRKLFKGTSLGLLRAARGSEPTGEAKQEVIDRILQGPPYDLAEIDESALPYWLQAVRWFADVVPELPAATRISHHLERRRLRNRLAVVAGPDFRGRDRELGQVRDWYADHAAGPLVVTGIGGIGKSALVARFAGELPDQVLLCWLDFDRADLAPDDPDSILELLTHQLAAQVDGFAPEPVAGDQPWQARARSLASAFEVAWPGRPDPLLVLDGFEVAQYVRGYGEIWSVLEEIMNQVDLRVIVSGRGEVPGLTLRGRHARRLSLQGLDRPDAADWLRQRGVTEPAILGRVLDLTIGIPLALRLAVRYVDSGGTAEELPQHLPQAMVEGLLYTRILERVMDPELILVARDALVLRRVTVDIIAAVLGPAIPDGLDAAEVFARLTRELGLITEDDADQVDLTLQSGREQLRLRPEVRSAALKLLESDDPDRVRAVDQRAAAWYATRDPENAADAAELVYHRLRLGDLAGAAAAWQDACGPLLGDVEPELPLPARSWLQERHDVTATAAFAQLAYEEAAAARIRSALARGNLRAVEEILGERTARAPQGVLHFYDAWQLWQNGDLAGAWRATAAVADNPGADRNLELLRAVVARDLGAESIADLLLQGLQPRERWLDLPDPRLLALGVWAARARLTVDLTTEHQLLAAVIPGDRQTFGSVMQRYLRPSDVVLDQLSLVLGPGTLSARTSVPRSAVGLETFADRLRQSLTVPPGSWPDRLLTGWAGRESPWRAPAGSYVQVERRSQLPAEQVQQALDLAVLARRRLNLITADLSLGAACKQALHEVQQHPLLNTAVVGTLAAFRCLPLQFRNGDRVYRDLDEVISEYPGGVTTWNTVNEAAERLFDQLHLYELPGVGPLGRARDEWRAVQLYAAGPDPLETLLKIVSGMPLQEG